MKVVTLDNQIQTINLGKFTKNLRNTSELHAKARDIIKQVYPCELLYEEVSLPILRNKTLFADFFLLTNKTVIEVHGQQHFKYIKHYHGNTQGFIESKKNDNLKIEWCELNNLELIAFNFNETEDEWRNKLQGSITKV